MLAATGALTVKNTVDDLAKADPSNPAGISLSLTLGSSKSESNQTNSGTQAVGSTVAAGNNVNIVATGNGKNSDITVTGSRISAGGDATLDAEGAILLQAARSTAEQHSKNDSSSAGVGVSASLGAKIGIGLTASASAARGHADGSDLTHSNTRVEAGHTVTIRSGSDTTLKGAVVAGRQVIADIGGDLKIASLQDTSTYDGKQQSAGGSLTVGISNMPVSGSISASRSNIDSSYASVVEQSGIKAGDGGFQIQVEGNTDLKGGIIASSQQAVEEQKNRLTTATLTTSDIENRSDASASSSGFGISTDMLTQEKYGFAKGLLGNALNNAKESESSEGKTRAAISRATITLTDEAEQLQRTGQDVGQTVASLNHDIATTHAAAERIDAGKLEKTVEAERAIKQETIKAVATLTDEAYRSRFQREPTLIKVVCTAEPSACIKDPGLLVRSAATEEDIANAPRGSILAVNGIFNNEQRGAELAYQNALPDEITNEKPNTVYMMHIAPADNSLSELLAVAYEKITASADYGLANFLGYTNGQELYADLLRSRSTLETSSLGHSRGTLVQEASVTILANRPDKNGNTYTNSHLTVRGVAGAANAEAYSRKAIQIVGEERKDQVTYSYFSNDPVSVVSGGNVGSTSLLDLWDVYKSNNSMHSCMGTGAAGCAQVERPVPGGPQGTPEGNARLIKYEGGKRVDTQTRGGNK